MIRIFAFCLTLLTSVLVQAQFNTIIIDASNDGYYPNLLDAKSFGYKYNHKKDSLYFKFQFDALSSEQSKSIGLNVLISINEADLDKFYFYGKQNIYESWNYSLSVSVKKQYDGTYDGFVGINDAKGFNNYLSPEGVPKDLLSLKEDNISIKVNLESKEIILGLLRSDLIPNNFFTKDSIIIGISAAVGTYALFNDDLYSPNLKITLKTSDTFQKKTSPETKVNQVETLVQQTNPEIYRVEHTIAKAEKNLYPIKNNDDDPYFVKKVYPNFVDFEFTFNLNSSLTINVIKLFSPEGKEVFRGYTNVVNVEKLVPGQYTLVVKTNNGFELRELVNVK
jgi:hypothetical protein